MPNYAKLGAMLTAGALALAPTTAINAAEAAGTAVAAECDRACLVRAMDRYFVALVDLVGARMERAEALDASGRQIMLSLPWWAWNVIGQQGVFLLSRR